MRLSFLDRFRPVGAPGAAATAVPAADRRGPEEELAPVFAALAPDVRAAEEAVAAAQRSAADAREEARASAASIVERAHADAAAARAEAALQVESAAAAADRDIVDAARAEADRIDDAARRALPAAVDRVVGRLREELLERPEKAETVS
ncbi:hypothetical protein P0L94_04235 [Microbacter sp. GSS18]|nr:hypothetical protein P0L94_04235 [Microbacter sp. GSS18]